MRHLYIFNPHSISDEETEEAVRAIQSMDEENRENRADSAGGAGKNAVHISRFPRDGTGFIPQFVKSLPQGEKLRVCCIGGDGILFDCLGGIMNAEDTLPDIELSCRPCGRTNSFMANFTDTDLSKNADRLWDMSKGEPRKIDIIDCGSNYAMNFIQIGLGGYVKYASRDMRMHIPRSLRNSSAVTELIYDIVAVSAILRTRVTTQNYIVNLDGEDLTGTYAQVHIANGAYCSDHFKMSPASDVSDGLLDLILVKSAPVSKLMPAIVKYYMRGRLDEYMELAKKGSVPDLFVRRQGKSVKVSSDRLMYSSIDGESFTSYRTDMKIISSKLNFVV